MPADNNNRDVFGLDSRIGGAWTLDGAIIEIEGGDKLVVTSIDITYRRQSQKFSPLNQNHKYLAVGEADGNLTMGMVIGPHAAIICFLQRYSDVCKIKESTLKVSPSGLRYSTGSGTDAANCKSKFAQVYFICSGCLLNSVRISVQQTGGALTVVNAGVDMQFISLKVGPNPPGGCDTKGGGKSENIESAGPSTGGGTPVPDLEVPGVVV